MKLSIVVAIYNVEKYINRCIDSIIKQKYNDIEIILVDDGSTDKSGIICDEYSKKDRRIKVIHQKNKGLSEARNKGIKLSIGDYITFIDGDDYIEDNYIEILLPKLNNENDIIVFNYNKIIDNKKNNIVSFYDFKNDNTKYILSHCMAWNKVFKKELLNNKKFPPNHIYEDLYLIPTLVLKTKKIIFLNQYLYNYVIRENSITSLNNNINDKIYSLNNVYSKLKDKYKEEVEYLYIYNLIIPSIKNEIITKEKQNIYKLNKLVKEKFPKYYKNKYLKKGIKLYLFFVYYNFSFISNLIGRIKVKVDSNG